MKHDRLISLVLYDIADSMLVAVPFARLLAKGGFLQVTNGFLGCCFVLTLVLTHRTLNYYGKTLWLT